jgi:hypothetical protein
MRNGRGKVARRPISESGHLIVGKIDGDDGGAGRLVATARSIEILRVEIFCQPHPSLTYWVGYNHRECGTAIGDGHDAIVCTEVCPRIEYTAAGIEEESTVDGWPAQSPP